MAGDRWIDLGISRNIYIYIMIIMAMGIFSAFINLIRDIMISEDFIKLARQVVQYKYIKAVLWIFRLKLLAIC